LEIVLDKQLEANKNTPLGQWGTYHIEAPASRSVDRLCKDFPGLLLELVNYRGLTKHANGFHLKSYKSHNLRSVFFHFPGIGKHQISKTSYNSWWWYINTATDFLNVLRCPNFFIWNNVLETGLCLCTQLGPINRASPYHQYGYRHQLCSLHPTK
jgi:hypothetical protein